MSVQRFFFPALIMFLALSPMLGACQNTTTPQLHDGMLMAHESTMPAEVRAADLRTREAYQYAVANPELFQQIPCYCGCVGIGHVNLYDCYVAEPGTDGQFTYDPHALGCSICVDIAQDTVWLAKQGNAPPDIKAYIDRNFAKFGPSNMPAMP